MGSGVVFRCSVRYDDYVEIQSSNNVRTSSRRRIIPRYSLRTLLLAMLSIAVFLGFPYTRAKRQERAVAAIEKAGGRVTYDWQLATHGLVAQQPQPPGPAWLRKLIGPHYFDTVVGVDISHTLVHGSPEKFEPFRAPLQQLPRLKRLQVFWQQLDDADYAAIGLLRGLKELTLVKMELSEAGARQIARLTNLRDLSLHDDIVPAAALVEIKGLTKLESMSVYCRHEDRAANGASIWNLEKYAIRDDALASLPTLTSLKSLSLTFTQISDDGMAIVGRMPQLEGFFISSPRITNASMDHLTKLPKLRSLELSVCGMDREGVRRLSELPNLTRLRISGPAIGDDCVPILANLEKVDWLAPGGKTIDESGLSGFEKMKCLKVLDLQSTDIKADCEAVKQLRNVRPDLQIYLYTPSLSPFR